MDKIKFDINIKAPKEEVWNALWDNKHYAEWTSVFCEGSHVESDWAEGSKVIFLNGEGSGMVAIVETNDPHEFMSFKHIGMYANGVEDTESAEVQQWAGAHENYTLTTISDGLTKLSIDVDTDEKYVTFFSDVWPKALAKVKEIAEKSI
jgi:hypothetical protein